MSDRNDSQRAAFDDDRLLDYALGLEDDPELAAALSVSARLRERLADLKSDLAAIETELRGAIPPVDESYAAPDAARWPRLQRSFGDDEAVRRRPRRGRRLTAALVAAALALAIVIGVAAILPHGQSSPSTASHASSKSAESVPAPAGAAGAASGQGSQGGALVAPGGATNGAATPTLGGGSASGPVALKAAAYRDVAVVRAGPIRGADQSFTVVRTLKGSPPASFSLVLRAIGSAPLAGSLAIAYLRPLVAATSGGLPTFSYERQQALVVALPTGIAPAAVRLPK